MAFSTQMEFFHVPFMHEEPEYKCKTACVQLKSYDSCKDNRSWSRDKRKRSQFLSDLVTCQLPMEDVETNKEVMAADMSSAVYKSADTPSRTNVGNPQSRSVMAKTAGDANMPSRSVMTNAKLPLSQHNVGDSTPLKPTKSETIDEISTATVTRTDQEISQLNAITIGGDSLLECANAHLTDYQKLLNLNTSLEMQLAISDERLKIADEENHNIKEMLTSKLDHNMSKDFFNKIQKLITNGKLTKNEENEFLQICKKMENMQRTYDVVRAENNYVKRLVEKLSARVTMEQLQIDNETSTDVKYLQNKINTLRKECLMLRTIEDDYHKAKQANQTAGNPAEQDIENIKQIIKERNVLREKCNSLKNLEQTVATLKDKNKQLHSANSVLHNDLAQQYSCIRSKEWDMHNMQKDYEQKLEKAYHEKQCLRAQLKDLNDEIVKLKCQTLKTEMVRKENACLRNEISKRDTMLCEYDCQYKQLMNVVEELRGMKLQNNHTPTGNDQVDDLAFFTCATLEEIMKEMKNKGCVQKEINSEYNVNGVKSESKDEIICNRCSETLKRLQELEGEKKSLENENYRIQDLIKEGEKKMVNMLNKIEHLDGAINENADELKKSSYEMTEAKRLVEDISSIHIQNQQLVNAVGAINSRDDEKIIDDLRRQLEEETLKLTQCKQENLSLAKLASDRENELKSLKELNNKLQKDIASLQYGTENKATENFKKSNENVENNYDDKQHTNSKNKKDKKLINYKPISEDDSKTSTIDIAAFVVKSAEKLKTNFSNGGGFEKELSKLFKEFILEYSACRDRSCCCSRQINYKSKLSKICHKLYHSGLKSLSFIELAYMHKKIYMQAEVEKPGFLLHMLLKDNLQDILGILNITPEQLSHSMAGQVELKSNKIMQRCCSCKQELCCTKSEEMLKEEVHKLSRDVESVQILLESLKQLPYTSEGDFIGTADNNDSTYRAITPVQKMSTKHFKKLKTPVNEHPDIYNV
ncbi:putative leucine-rich repeat-containing protein DDB_G0290503 [Stomoxys calcitrans]|uniref:putative leucine-rich repeat-containing protein DDB_G0290503 n=1 Tax=Stomoxys calcitrans TaxID=35570 RepID=UPI0027E3560C|nr:putative leucine-rich repeat-containing protein DDB_G0290503 [Stomoxys calcitrans]